MTKFANNVNFTKIVIIKMNYKQGVCRKCGKNRIIVNKHFYLCEQCNNIRLESKKDTKCTGELEIFEEIWKEREHLCVNCGRYLGEELNICFFSHIKPKSIYPELRLNKDNIELNCFDCHFEHEFGIKKNG